MEEDDQEEEIIWDPADWGRGAGGIQIIGLIKGPLLFLVEENLLGYLGGSEG